jgi:hypothetical protein
MASLRRTHPEVVDVEAAGRGFRGFCRPHAEQPDLRTDPAPLADGERAAGGDEVSGQLPILANSPPAWMAPTSTNTPARMKSAESTWTASARPGYYWIRTKYIRDTTIPSLLPRSYTSGGTASMPEKTNTDI